MTHKVCWSTLCMFVLLIPPARGDDPQGMLVYIVYVCIADTTRRGDELQGMLVYIVYVCLTTVYTCMAHPGSDFYYKSMPHVPHGCPFDIKRL